MFSYTLPHTNFQGDTSDGVMGMWQGGNGKDVCSVQAIDSDTLSVDRSNCGALFGVLRGCARAASLCLFLRTGDCF